MRPIATNIATYRIKAWRSFADQGGLARQNLLRTFFRVRRQRRCRPRRRRHSASGIPALLCGLFGLMGVGFAMAWVCVCDSARRSLVLAQGMMMVGTTVVSFLGCLGVTPMLMCGIPWASSGGSLAALSWLALGVLASAMLDKTSPSRELSEREVLAIVVAAVLWTILGR